MQAEILRLTLGVTSPTPPTSPLIEGAAADEFYTFLEVRGDEHYFVGHFPDYPIMPGVLLVEAMAQTARLMAADRFGADVEAYLVGVGKTRFFKPVLPPARLRFMARLQSRPESADNLIRATCTAFMGETRAAKTEVVLSFHRRS